MGIYRIVKGVEFFIPEKPISCETQDLFATFSEGGLIIAENRGSNSLIKAHIKPYKTDIETYIQIVEKIWKEHKNNSYLYYIVEDADVSDSNTNTISLILETLTEHKEFITHYIQPGSHATIKRHVFAYRINSVVDASAGLMKYKRYIDLLKPEVAPNEKLLNNMKQWIESTSFSEFYEEISKTVIGQSKLKLVLINVYKYVIEVCKTGRHHCNTILTAPSGSGKTETYRALKEYFKDKIPGFVVGLSDLTDITLNGYKGNDTITILNAFNSSQSCGYGIIFLDEFDKKILPQYAGKDENVNAAIQSQLLLYVEGNTITLNEKESKRIDTSKTMFVAMGSFDFFRSTRGVEKSFGFSKPDSIEISHYEEITREDIIKAGGSYELIGRFTSLINYGKLSHEAIDRIIDKRLSEFSCINSFEISISPEFRELLHNNANTNFGCRLLTTIISDALNNVYIEYFENGYRSEPARITLINEDSYTIEIQHSSKGEIEQ